MSELFPDPVVLLVAGSPSDLDTVFDCQEVLEQLGLPSAIRVVSAHRTPDATVEVVSGAAEAGFRVIIAFAGLSAHLAGVAAAHTHLPVIGVPLAVGPLAGVDALLASAQMPPGTPVAVVAIGAARNAALLAGRMLGITEPAVRERLVARLEAERARYAPDAIQAEVDKRRQARRDRRSG